MEDLFRRSPDRGRSHQAAALEMNCALTYATTTSIRPFGNGTSVSVNEARFQPAEAGAYRDDMVPGRLYPRPHLAQTRRLTLRSLLRSCDGSAIPWRHSLHRHPLP
jgi:hypothetical protein